MTVEQEKTLAALKASILMEIDGKSYYLKASKESGNELGEKLLRQLATEEDAHRKTFEKIFASIEAKKGWPATIDFHPNAGAALKTVFAEASERLGKDIQPAASELEAVQGAIDMEAKTYDFYREQLGNAACDAEKEFYRSLAEQERQHQLVLVDYQEFLHDPSAWFVRQEHHSLDGG